MRILIGLLVGIVGGLLARMIFGRPDGSLPEQLTWIISNVARPVGEVFVRLILMVVVPMVFVSLVVGVASVGDLRRLGRLGINTLALTVVFSSISVAIGLSLVNGFRPGEIIGKEQRVALQERYKEPAAKSIQTANAAKSPRDALLDIIPRNPLQEMVGALDGSSRGGGMLAVMFFALMCGIGLALQGSKGAPLLSILESIFDVLMAIIHIAMKLAPFAVAAMLFAMTAELGVGIVTTLGGFVATVIAGLFAQMSIVYVLAIWLIARRPVLAFFRDISEAITTAFATSSSNATLPTSLRVAEQKLKLRPDTSRFVLTVGATANQNGTALYEGITVFFLAQVFGVPLGFEEQIKVAFMCILAGIGTAGVPSGSIPLIVLVLQTVNVPPDAIGVILGVDRLLDMCRTTVNVAGDLTIAACVDRTPADPASA